MVAYSSYVRHSFSETFDPERFKVDMRRMKNGIPENTRIIENMQGELYYQNTETGEKELLSERKAHAVRVFEMMGLYTHACFDGDMEPYWVMLPFDRIQWALVQYPDDQPKFVKYVPPVTDEYHVCGEGEDQALSLLQDMMSSGEAFWGDVIDLENAGRLILVNTDRIYPNPFGYESKGSNVVPLLRPDN